jgi:hypothetical protein
MGVCGSIVTETILVFKNGYEVYFVLFLRWSTGTLARIQNKLKHDRKPSIQHPKCSTYPLGKIFIILLDFEVVFEGLERTVY